MARHRLARWLVSLALLLGSPVAAWPSAPSPEDRTHESGWSAEGFVDPAYEAERAQLAIVGSGPLLSVWAGRLTSDAPFQLRSSQLVGTGWTPSAAVFAPTTASERLPQLSRAADGTLWMAWLRDDNQLGSGSFHAPSLLAARCLDGVWSPPETVAVETPALNPKVLEIGFSILGINQDVAWLTWGVAPDGDPFSGDRDLVYSKRSASGWAAPQVLSDNGLTETHPILVPTTSGAPIVLFSFSNAPSLLRAMRWTGSAWSTPDDLTATAIYGYDAAPDTNGAVRVVAILRETDPSFEYHIREYTYDSAGFHPKLLINSAPVVVGGENDPPDWSGVAIASALACPICANPLYDFVYRVFWIDFTQGGTPKVLSSVRTKDGYRPLDQVGTSFETAAAFPNAVHEIVGDRWYATWTAPPSFGGRKRAKFAFTQEFAGDIALGAAYVAPDTVRVSIVCSGDATGRAFRLYRLNWAEGQGSPPFSPPVPAAAVALPGNPFSGPCPFQVDDFPGPGRWFYYLELEAEGPLPGRSARSFNAAVVPQDGGGGGEGDISRLLVPRPQPAVGSVSLPFDLVEDSEVVLTIRDLRGRIVRSFDLGLIPAGAYRAAAPVWYGLDDRGAPVRSGMYFAALSVNGRVSGDAVRVLFLP
jgi:hypothetical protein